ncbi:hypothetical protein [endosymbiont GvMRE of Glomus versiforme]|uniref:hypothetical protein n=1 Tax=endosymbiont GvMRE of Glomus versiforme TaxID=2039283 RepID=UPI000EC30EF7|nr:hypothetical protein [endosymbiont GvMRE of Glomus versiforme]RHZ35722.1 hypothetical protein GvMRE_Ic6g12 [endosymbiont GvMRE of Glomus versiforme]RHZ35725.1 hypothetical protein GvMRE_Ic6g18 [endosymbiont GvMRE of Glomus versiforme]
MPKYSCHKCQKVISKDVYQLKSKGSYLSFCQSCSKKGIELGGKIYRLCFDSDCSKGKKIYLARKEK